ncbi:hypothetical protein GCM10018793_55730 [Streptomyces sulfonofaciens]|uniref:Hydroxyurea phosphotransferase n=1 Tax=Streptomyces sulfonofaciens TaxID=68272 RepID=A0A919L6N3_9ACTN|nr:aminoglycoside phosphotransferase family protein [Streptomyces sulfonofaciens]GHH85917.1 hypothetical protein GCM10018793_55730 [Streptomyces sulfonofaciens]
MMEIPEGLVTAQTTYNGALGRAFVAVLPERAAVFLRRWRLTRDGPAMSGTCALVLPVRRADGTPAALKLQHLDEETEGEPVALRAWGGLGAVRLLEHDAETGTMLLERLDSARHLTSVADSRDAVLVIAGLLARLTAVRAPGGLRDLGTIARDTAARAPVVRRIADPRARRVLEDCAAALEGLIAAADATGEAEAQAAEVGAAQAEAQAERAAVARPGGQPSAGAGGPSAGSGGPFAGAGGHAAAGASGASGETGGSGERRGSGGFGDRLLHWDLHFGNVLAGGREPWLAIDPKPLAGDPCFELFPALHNRFEASEVVWRFDAMTDVLGLDRARARNWTLVRVLQFCLWDVGQGRPPGARQLEVARRLLGR